MKQETIDLSKLELTKDHMKTIRKGLMILYQKNEIILHEVIEIMDILNEIRFKK